MGPSVAERLEQRLGGGAHGRLAARAQELAVARRRPAAARRGTTTGRRAAGRVSCRPSAARRTARSRSRGSSAGTAAWRGTRSPPGRASPARGRAPRPSRLFRRRRQHAELAVHLAALAEGHERALERPPAAGSRGHHRQRAGEQLVEAAHPAGDVRHERPRLVGDGDLAQQAAVVAAARVHEVGVDDGDAEHVQRHAGALGDPPLDGDVLQVVLLEPGRRLDLDHAVAAVAPLEHVGADEHAAVAERGLVEGDVAGLARASSVSRSAWLRSRPSMSRRRRTASRHLADVVARGEASLGVGAVDLELRAMHGEPEAFAALQSGGDA